MARGWKRDHTVGVGGPLEWLQGKWGDVTGAWGRGDYGAALGEAAMTPFEVVPKAAEYLVGGPIMGSAMAARQALRGDVPDEGIGIKNELPWDIPSFNLLNEEKTIPAANHGIQDILDWDKAEGRFNAINPHGQFLLDTTLSMGPGSVPKLLGKEGAIGAVGALEKTHAADLERAWYSKPVNVPGGETWESVDKLVPNPAGMIENAMTSYGADALGTVASGALKLGVPTGVAINTWTNQDDATPTWQRAMNAGIAAMATSAIIGKGMGAIGKVKRASLPERPDQFQVNEMDVLTGNPATLATERAAVADANTVLGTTINPGRATSQGFRAGGTAPAHMYPGGNDRVWGIPLINKYGADMFVAKVIDRLAPFETIQAHVARTKYQFTNPGVKLTEAEDAVANMRRFSGSAKATEKYLQAIGYDMKAADLNMGDTKVMAQFNTWLNAEAIAERIRTGKDTAGLVASNPDHVRMVNNTRWVVGQQVDANLGAGTATKFKVAMDQLLMHFNAQIDRSVAAGVLSPVNAARMKAAKSLYAYATDAEFFEGRYPEVGDAAWLKQSRGNSSMLTAQRGIGTQHSSGELFNVDLMSTLEHFIWRERLIQKNQIGQSLVNWRTADPAGWGQIMRDTTKDAPDYKGFSKVPVIQGDDVKWFEMPDDLHELVMGLDSENADIMSRLMGKLGEPFRAGVTAFSLPFIFRNISRDLQTVLLQNGFSSLNAQSYIDAFYDVATQGKFGDLLTKFSHVPGIKDMGVWADMEKRITSPTRWHNAIDAAGNPIGREMTYAQEMLTHGGGMGTLSEVLGPSKERAAQMLDVEPKGLLAGGIHIPVVNPFDLIRRGAETLEMATRVGVYKVAREAGKTATESALLARESTVDFSRGGSALRILNMYFPLLNARVQGTNRTWRAMNDDALGFAARSYPLLVVPTMAAYIHNRRNFPDTYDKTNQETRDAYWLIQIGEYEDGLGTKRPINFTIAKDQTARIIAAPVEYMLDKLFKVEAYGKALPADKRTERDATKMATDLLWQLFPVNINNNDMYDPGGSWAAVVKGMIAGNPLLGTTAQMVTNQDWSRGSKPIEDPNSKYAPDQNWTEDVTNPTARMIAQALGQVPGNAVLRPAPSQVAFFFKNFGGTAGQMLLGAGDTLFSSLGIAPAREVDPRTMVIPPGTTSEQYEKAQEMLQKVDTRPAWVKFLSPFFSAAGTQQTQAAKVQQLTEKEQQQYTETRDYYSYIDAWRYETYYPQKWDAEKKVSSGLMSHAQFNNFMFDLNTRMSQRVEDGQKKYKNAIVDPEERKAFAAKLPGVPVDWATKDVMLKELSGTKMAEAIARFDNPPELAGSTILSQAATNPAAYSVVSRYQQAELMKMASEWGMDPNDVRDQITATKQGKHTLPALMLPAVDIEVAVAEYKKPEGFTDADIEDIDNKSLMVARTTAIRNLAAKWKVPYEQLMARVKGRLAYPEEKSELIESRERALALSAKTKDEIAFPAYMAPNGKTLGDPSSWKGYDADLAAIKTKYGTDYNKWPPAAKRLDDARRLAEFKRIDALTKDEDYLDYQRWFGIGREMTGVQWDAYVLGRNPQTGERVTRYRKGTPEQWLQLDRTRALYEAAPRGSPYRKRLAPTVKQINKLMDPGWRRTLLTLQAKAEAGTKSGDLSRQIYADALDSIDSTDEE